eukprot:1139948-Pleurochrysis_carterae.AAC.1
MTYDKLRASEERGIRSCRLEERKKQLNQARCMMRDVCQFPNAIVLSLFLPPVSRIRAAPPNEWRIWSAQPILGLDL